MRDTRSFNAALSRLTERNADARISKQGRRTTREGSSSCGRTNTELSNQMPTGTSLRNEDVVDDVNDAVRRVDVCHRNVRVNGD